MIEQETMTIPNTKYNKFCWALLRISTGFWLASVALILIGLLASVAGAQTLFDIDGISHRTILVDGETYIVTTIDNGDWSSSYITGSGGSASSSFYDLGEDVSLTTITAEPSMWGYEGNEGDTMKSLLFIETYRQIEDAERQAEHEHWLGCEHPND